MEELMRISSCALLALLLVACSDDTKPAPQKDSTITKNEAKAPDGPIVKTEGGAGDKGPAVEQKVGKDGPSVGKDGVSAGIGPAGGQIKSADGKMGLDVPAGALTTTVAFAITPAAAPPASEVAKMTKATPVTVDGKAQTISVKTTHSSCWVAVKVAGAPTVLGAFDLTPDGQTFAVPATITFYQVQIGDWGYEIYWKAGKCPIAA
jgi:hypothetical protein